MANDRDSTGNLLRVAFLVCLMCGIVVSATAVTLRPLQEENRVQFRHVTILRAAGMYQPGMNVHAAFERIERRFIELESGEPVEMPADYDPLRAARDPAASRPLEVDPAGIRRLPDVGEIWLVRDDDGEIRRVVLPVHGLGLWGTMYGFLALEPDLNTVSGITFYDHGETPGLGGQIESPRWQRNWEGKALFDGAGNVAIRVIKGRVDPADPDFRHTVDGISGATLTTRGVDKLVRFWVGEEGYGPTLERLRRRL
jgi:Na+-transporting NADH:ubiquinone oxidoreductase subunit C